MPDFMKGLADGIDKSKKYVEKAVGGVAKAMQLTMDSDLNYSLNGISGAIVGGSGGRCAWWWVGACRYNGVVDGVWL